MSGFSLQTGTYMMTWFAVEEMKTKGNVDSQVSFSDRVQCYKEIVNVMLF